MKTSPKDKILFDIKRDQEEISKLAKKIEQLNLNVQRSIESLRTLEDSETVDLTGDIEEELALLTKQAETTTPPRAVKERTPSKDKVTLIKEPSGRIRIGDKVRVINKYIGKYGNLFGKIGTVVKVGKTFIFIDIPDVPTTQQRSESNVELITQS